MTNLKEKMLAILPRAWVYVAWIAIFSASQLIAHLIPHACTL